MAQASMHVQLVDTLGARITTGDMPPGSVVNLATLESEFGVSRTVAREAMRLLESLGLIIARRRVGLIVAEMDKWDVLSPRVIAWRLAGDQKGAQLRTLTDLRIAIEPIAARQAAIHASEAQRTRLVELAAELRRVGVEFGADSAEYLEVDREFHAIVLSASGNEMFQALTGAVWAVLEGRNRAGRSPRAPIEQALVLHRKIAEAIQRGDEDEAEVTSRAQVLLVRREIE